MALHEEKTKKLLRLNALAAGILGLLASPIVFAENFPFPKILAFLSLGSSVCYFAYYLLFDLLFKNSYRAAGIALSQMGVVVITATIFITGGLVSPFIFLYFALLVAESIYGLENPYTLPLCVLGYLVVVSGEFFGFFSNPSPWSVEVYRSPLAVSMIATLTVCYLCLTRGMSRAMVGKLREQVQDEAAEKDTLLKKFSELNATSQLGVLAHRIAHDLRGPIASISGYLEMEAAKERSPEDREALNDVISAVDGMTEALHGITRFGKPGGPSSEKIVMADFIKDLLAIAAFAPRSKGVVFNIDCPEGNAVCVTGSRADLQQAIFNIVKNAVEAVSDNPDGKRVSVSVRRAGKDAMVSVSDNGPGIPEELLKSVFRKSVTTKKDGTGVGLMITRDLLVRNGGEVKLRNRDDGGLTVEISVPLS